jgi:hypothetical protein
MTLQELFDRLATGELTNLSMAKTGSIDPTAYTRLTRYTNEALLKLYTRFRLKENDLLLALYDPITIYHLIPRFSLNYVPVGNTDNAPIRYIWDLPGEKFTDELLKVLTVYDQSGNLVPLNDDAQPYSVFTPQAKQLQVPNPSYGAALNIHYQQRHTILSGNLSDIIELPEVLEEALTSYIACKVFSHMNSENSSQKAQEFLNAFEAVCNEVVDRDLVNSSISQTNTRFCRGGWI